MSNILERLARMPRFIYCYKKLRHIVSIILFLLTVPFVICLKLLLALPASWYQFLKKGTVDKTVDAEHGVLNEKQIEEIIDYWINAHREKFDFIEKKQANTPHKNFTDSYLEISLYPKNQKSLPLKFEIGGQVLLFIRFAHPNQKQFIHGFEFDTENGGEHESINDQELENILESYLQGNYYVIYSMIDENIIASELHMKNLKTDYTSYYGDPCFFEKVTAIQKEFKFDHL